VDDPAGVAQQEINSLRVVNSQLFTLNLNLSLNLICLLYVPRCLIHNPLCCAIFLSPSASTDIPVAYIHVDQYDFR
jgi:hypothetical protein